MEVNRALSYPTTMVRVDEVTQVGEARRAAAELSANLQFDESTAGETAIIVNELGTNLVRHGGGGELLFNPSWCREGSCLDIIAIDKGKGMADFAKCLGDGFSTGGTAGNGLGAVKRLASLFDVVSIPDGGTTILARMYRDQGKPPPGCELKAGVVNLPLLGEPVSGDSWAMVSEGPIVSVMVADGLGHGVSAAEASREAIRVFRKEGLNAPAFALQAAHSAMRGTRGAAVAISQIDLSKQTVTYCGVGNISGTVVSADMTSRSMVSHNGIIGHEAKRFTEFVYPWSEGAHLVMFSDGLQSQVTFHKYPGIMRRDAALIAAILYRDFNRGRDDSTVVVVKV